jgi:hypothetical protein
MKFYIFRTVPLSIIRSYSLYTQQWYMSYRQLSSSSRRIRMELLESCLYDIPLLSVQWITPDDGQRNCPKYVEFHFQNKFEKLVHLVGFIIRTFIIYCQLIITQRNEFHQSIINRKLLRFLRGKNQTVLHDSEQLHAANGHHMTATMTKKHHTHSYVKCADPQDVTLPAFPWKVTWPLKPNCGSCWKPASTGRCHVFTVRQFHFLETADGCF